MVSFQYFSSNSFKVVLGAFLLLALGHVIVLDAPNGNSFEAQAISSNVFKVQIGINLKSFFSKLLLIMCDLRRKKLARTLL